MCVLSVERCHCRRIPGIEGVGPRSRDLVGRGAVPRRRWSTSTRRERDACGRGDSGQHYSTAVQVLHLQTPSRRRLIPPRCVPCASWIKEFRCCRGRSMHRASLRCIPIPRRDAFAGVADVRTPRAIPEKFAPFLYEFALRRHANVKAREYGDAVGGMVHAPVARTDQETAMAPHCYQDAANDLGLSDEAGWDIA